MCRGSFSLSLHNSLRQTERALRSSSRIACMSPDSTIAAPPKRRWYQYSLRTLFVFVTVCCVVCALGIKLNEARKQRDIVAAIERMWGEVDYDCDDPRPRIIPGGMGGTVLGIDPGSVIPHVAPTRSPPAVPDWLFQMMGKDFWGDVVVVRLRGGYGDVDGVFVHSFELLANLPHLRGVVIRGAFTSAELAHLAQLSNLEELALNCPDFYPTDLMLDRIKRMKRLQYLVIWSSSLTDANLGVFTDMQQLKELQLFSGSLTPAGVERLRTALPKCKIVAPFQDHAIR